MQAMRLKMKLYVWKAFPFDWECSWNFQPEILPKWKVPLVSGLRIATKSIQQSFGPKWEYIDKTGVGDHLIRQTEHVVAQFYPCFRHVLLVFFLTLVIHSYITMTQNKSSSNLEPKHTLLPVSCRHFVTFYQLCSHVDFPLLSATPLDTSLNLN